MNKETLIEKLLNEKAEKNNTIDLNAYANGLQTMYEYQEKQPHPVEFGRWILKNANVIFDESGLLCWEYNYQMIGTHELYEIFLKEFNRINNHE